MKHVIDLSTFSKKDFFRLIEFASEMKMHPQIYSGAMHHKTLLMIFEKPSLRTRVSFEVGMTQMGGHAIYYNLSTSPMGKKESVADTARTASRYVDIIMARLFSHEQLIEFAKNASVPVINAMTDFSHPCQILSDLLTIKEKKGSFENITLCYLGDANNNVTHSLMFGCAIVGIDLRIGCPTGYSPRSDVVAKSRTLSNSQIMITSDPKEAITNADVVYTDSWMSYHIAKEEQEARINIFTPYRVTNHLMSFADKNAIFMNCLPANRSMEQTADVIDGPRSVVFDQAENRLHMQKALMLWLVNSCTS